MKLTQLPSGLSAVITRIDLPPALADLSLIHIYVAIENTACQRLLSRLNYKLEKRFDFEDQSVLVYHRIIN